MNIEEHVMKSRRQHRRWAIVLAGLVVAPALGAAVAAVVTSRIPKVYSSSLRIEIPVPTQNYEVFTNCSTLPPLTPEPSFMEVQTQKIRSKHTLYPVIDQLGLTQRWKVASNAEAYQKLLDSVKINGVAGTQLARVTVNTSDPQLAADLANAIVRRYQYRMDEVERFRSDNALELLNAQETLQRQRVDQARRKTLELMNRFHIVDFEMEDPGPKDGSHNEWALSGSRRQVEREAARITAHLKTLGELEGDQIVEKAIELKTAEDSTVQLYTEKQKLLGKIEQVLRLKSGNEHSDVRAPQSRRDEVDRLLKKGIDGVLASLNSRLETAGERLERFRKNDEERSPEEHRNHAQYAQAKRTYETQKTILENMNRALAKERADLSSSATETVIIHKRAEPSFSPIYPDKPRNLLIGLLAGSLVFFVPIGTARLCGAFARLRS